jgi:hypothetical protein
MYVDSTLEAGISRPSATYASPCLASAQTFQVSCSCRAGAPASPMCRLGAGWLAGSAQAAWQRWSCPRLRSCRLGPAGGRPCLRAQVADVECWLLKPPEEDLLGGRCGGRAQQGGGSVLDKAKEDQHLLQLAGVGSSHSHGLRGPAEPIE